MNKKKLTQMIIFLALACAALAALLLTDSWRGLDIAVNWSFATVAGAAALIFAALFLEKLIALLLGLCKPRTHRGETVVAVSTNLVKYICAIVIICGVLTVFGVDIVTIVAGLGIIALIIGFGAESLIADVVTGMFILLDNQYNVGDIIEVNGFRGTVSSIGIRTTCVTDTGGNVKIINNSDMKNVLNRSDNASKAVSDFAIAYDTDLEALEKKLPEMLEAIYAENRDVLDAAPVYLGVQELADSAIVLRFVAEVGESNIYSGSRALNRSLLLHMRKANIEVPFPQLDVHKV